MNKWLVRYARIPTNYNPAQNAIVEADTADDAKALVMAKLGTTLAQSTHVVAAAVPYEEPNVKGRIITMGEGQ